MCDNASVSFATKGMVWCVSFLSLPVKERFRKATCKGLCLQCLESGHRAEVCQKPPCKNCQSRHHSLLHQDSARSHLEEVKVQPVPKLPSSSSGPLCGLQSWQILLQWAQVERWFCRLHIPRCYSDFPLSQNAKVELHAFGDASEAAYASAVYLRVVHEDGNISTCLEMS